MKLERNTVMHEKKVCFALVLCAWVFFPLETELVNFQSQQALICKQLPQEQAAYPCSPAAMLDTPDFAVI